MANVILINPFEVPEGKDEEFLQGWEMARDFMQQQKGYVSTALHRSLDSKARFRFINVAEWKSLEDFYAALNNPEFATMRDSTPFVHYPSVYEVIRK